MPKESVRPPLILLAVAAAAVGVSAVLLLASGEAVNLAGYALATIIASLSIVAYRILDSRRRTRAGYERPWFARILPSAVTTIGLLAIGIAIGAVHVWRFADAVAKR